VTGPARTAPHRLATRRQVTRFALLLALLAAFGLVLLLAGPPDLAQVTALADRLGPATPVAAVLGAALLLIALVPRTFITLAWGAIFGPWQGAGYTLAAAGLAAALGFGMGRLLGREFVAERVRGRLARLDNWFARQSVLGVVTVRLLPVGGFGLVSYGYGTTGARPAPFLLGSVLASAPSAFGYAAVGASAVTGGAINWYAAAPAALGAIATAVLVVQGWRTARDFRGVSP
jgi:uncharacterized membrane protein YdjX (TVP38/TMEM64 family)